MNWYIHTHKSNYWTRNYIPRSLQVDIGNRMIRLFYYRNLFFVYLFENDEMIDLEIADTKQKALECELIKHQF